MSGIKYYQLGNNEEPPDEFCVVRDVNGEPEEYAWYEPMDNFDRKLWNIFKESDWVAASEHRKLREYATKLEQECHRLDSDNCDLLNDMRDMQFIIDESHKLRKLVQQMYPPAKSHLQLGVMLGCNDTLSYDWALQMTELGIEVPE